MFKKILFATDDSPTAKKAMEYVKDMASKYNAEVFVLHSWYLPERFNGQPTNHYFYLSKTEERMKEHGNKILDEAEADMKSMNVKVNKLLVKGPVGPTIVSQATGNNCDLIVMGSRGLSNISNLLISSASNYALHHAKCPVLLIH